MSDKPASNNSATAWIISIMAALVFYGLSFGPVFVLALSGTLPPASVPVLRVFYEPLWWMTEKLNLQEERTRYLEWWYKRLR